MTLFGLIRHLSLRWHKMRKNLSNQVSVFIDRLNKSHIDLAKESLIVVQSKIFAPIYWWVSSSPNNWHWRYELCIQPYPRKYITYAKCLVILSRGSHGMLFPKLPTYLISFKTIYCGFREISNLFKFYQNITSE